MTSEMDYLNNVSHTTLLDDILNKPIETCRTNVDNGSAGYLTLYATTGVKTYSTAAVGTLISASYAANYYNITILKKCKLVIMSQPTGKVERAEIVEANTSFRFPVAEYKEIIAIEEV